MSTVQIDKVKVPLHHRQVKPWVLRQVTESIQDHGFNPSYPITLDGDTLVDGRHRLEAAIACGLAQVPYIDKPDNVSPIRHSIRCNQDQTLGTAHDVFDYAELCYGLAQDGYELKDISSELGIGWGIDLVSKHKQIRDRLHPLAWSLARYTKNGNPVEPVQNNLVEPDYTKVDWKETHFRALLSHLSLNGKTDHAIMRAQVATIREALARFATPDKKVTAKWIGEVAERHAWHVQLARCMQDNLAPEVPLSDRKTLLQSIKKGVFGNAPDDKNLAKFQGAATAICLSPPSSTGR